MDDDLATTRRNALRTSVAAASAIGLAGCQGLLGGSGGDGGFEEEVTREDPREIHVGQTVHGTLQDGDGRDPRYDDIAEPLEFELDEERRLEVSMTSGDFDTYLLVSRNGDTVAENDDGGARLNSEMVETFDSGTYTIWAGSFSGTGTGEYTLELSSVDAADGGNGSADDVQSIDLGSTVQGELTDSSPRDPVYDDLAVPYTVSLDEETRVRIRMQSDVVDSFLVVTQNGTGVAENDDGGSGLNSDLITTLGAGEYTVWAGSFSGQDTGSFQFSVEELEERDVSPTAIEPGDTVQGTLSADAPRDPVNHDLADPYRFTLDSETRVRIAMESGPIDPLVLVTQDGSAVAVNDDGGEGLNSELITTLGAGTYTIWAGSFSGQDTGEYTLELEQV